MSTPTVTEISRPPEPVVHDTFIDDIPAVARDEDGDRRPTKRRRS